MRTKIAAASMMAALMLASAAWGQETQEQAAAERGQAQHVRAQAGETITLLEFPGGTLTEYIGQVERSAGPVNIVVSGPADDVRTPPVTLRNVDVRTALEVAIGLHRTPPFAAEPGHWVRLATPGTEDSAAVYLVTVEERPRTGQRPGTRGERMETAVISLRELLDARMQPETILTAVETALGADDEASEPVLRFHEPSSLLIVRAPAAQVRLVREVIDELSKSAETMRVQAELAEVRQEIARVRDDLEDARERRFEAEQAYSIAGSALTAPAPRGLEAAAEEKLQVELRERYAAASTSLQRATTQERQLRERLNELTTRARALEASADPARIGQLEAENARLRAEIASLKAQLADRD